LSMLDPDSFVFTLFLCPIDYPLVGLGGLDRDRLCNQNL
jgi:hypothetical protein